MVRHARIESFEREQHILLHWLECDACGAQSAPQTNPWQAANAAHVGGFRTRPRLHSRRDLCADCDTRRRRALPEPEHRLLDW